MSGAFVKDLLREDRQERQQREAEERRWPRRARSARRGCRGGARRTGRLQLVAASLCVFVDGMCFTRSIVSVLITTRNDSAVEQEAGVHRLRLAVAPAPVKRRASTANAQRPSTRATLNWIEFSATAFGRSFLSTSDGISD